jgi:hypothetical protein
MSSASYLGLPEKFSTDWKAIRSCLGELQLFWRFHARFCGDKQDVAMMEEILFLSYRVVRKALLFTIVMQVRSLLDPPKSWGRDNVSLAHFVGLFEEDYPVLHGKLSTLLKAIVVHCQNIENWGNRRVGHADLQTFLSHETLPEVSHEHFEKALGMMQELLQQVHANFYGPEKPIDIPELIDGADKLIFYIRAGRQAEVAKIEAML